MEFSKSPPVSTVSGGLQFLVKCSKNMDKFIITENFKSLWLTVLEKSLGQNPFLKKIKMYASLKKPSDVIFQLLKMLKISWKLAE